MSLVYSFGAILFPESEIEADSDPKAGIRIGHYKNSGIRIGLKCNGWNLNCFEWYLNQNAILLY